MKEGENRNIFTYDCLEKPEPKFRKALGKEDKFYELPGKETVLDFEPAENLAKWVKENGIKGEIHVNPRIIIYKKEYGLASHRSWSVEHFPPSGANLILENGKTKPSNLRELIAEKIEQEEGWIMTKALQKALKQD